MFEALPACFNLNTFHDSLSKSRPISGSANTTPSTGNYFHTVTVFKEATLSPSTYVGNRHAAQVAK